MTVKPGRGLEDNRRELRGEFQQVFLSNLWRSYAPIGALLLVFVAGADGRAAESIVADNPAAWSLTFNDEFEGTTLDAMKWGYRQLGPRKSGINTTNAAAVNGGLLTITTYTSGGIHYTGMISTQDKFEQAFGYYEARMKFQSSPGQWSAFWVQSPTYGTPLGNPALAGTEIDIVEHRATNRNGLDILNRYNSAVHWDGYGDQQQQTARTFTDVPGLGNGSWHTYAVKWSPSGYEFYYDNHLMWTANEPISTRPEYLILSSEVEDGRWAGTVPVAGYGSLATSTTNVQVDYVRVWSAVPAPPESADFDRDGDVDGTDFLTWQRGAETAGGAVHADGNANAGFDGDVDADDLAIWAAQFGVVATTASSVPEPGAGMLATVAAAGLISVSQLFAQRNGSTDR